MHIITISRQFSSGGRELGIKMAEILGYDFYDKEIISSIAANKKMDENYVARTLEQDSWTGFLMGCRCAYSGGGIQTIQTELLSEQTHVIEEIARAHKNCIIVGRNADVILSDYAPFNIYVYADTESKVRRYMERAGEDEVLTEKEAERKIRKVDKKRAQTRQIITSASGGDKNLYHLTVNTSGWQMDNLAYAVSEFALSWFKNSDAKI